MRAYTEYWGEGPPYADQWMLRDCRLVLEELGEPEPNLPPFDPSQAGPVKFEPELRAYIERLKQKKAAEESKKRGS